MTRLHAALARCVEWHRGQDRDGPFALPYAHHPMEVAFHLRWTAGVMDEDDLCAALLHDVLEESDVALEQISKEFGETTAGLVKELTRREPGPDETKGMSKSEVYELRTSILMDEARAMSPRAQRIKLCDRLSNLIEAKETRTEAKYSRYLRQTDLLLQAIPREASPQVWDRIKAILGTTP